MSKTILVVDDSESIRLLVTATLENVGYNVIVAVDGVDALQYITGDHLDLIITDLNMPNKDGIELIKNLRAQETYKFTPILLLTTESQADKKREAKEAGATGWIVKPFFQEKLITTIKKVLR